MGWFRDQAIRTGQSFKKVWASNYPKWLWFVNFAVGAVVGPIFAVYGVDGDVGTKVGVAIGVTVITALLVFAFTYGVIRARGNWNATRQGTGFGG